VQANLRAVRELASRALAQGAELLLTPEHVGFLDGRGRAMRAAARREDDHPVLSGLRELAAEARVWVLVGSIAVDTGEERIANRSLLLDASGATVARYDKLHMFDVSLPSGRAVRESSLYRPGDRAVLAQTPWGPIGLTVCYDLRFPQLYRALARAGAAFLTVPSAFRRATGVAHWEVLLRARAIETGCFVLAPATCGTHPGDIETHGHSLLVSPWGKVLADGGEAPGVVVADLDPAEVARTRAMLPALEHDREFAPPDGQTAPAGAASSSSPSSASTAGAGTPSPSRPRAA
jgi:predicted amidohydrolase